jgi:1-acyl-sn-glycerol-3-phosphate acyltransferase
MKTAARVIFAVWAYTWAVVWSVLIGLFYLVGAPFDPHAVWMDLSQQLYSRTMLACFLAPVRTEGREHIPLGQACVMMADHKSYLDIPASVVALKGMSIRFVAKRELVRIPFLGWALWASHHIKVDRANREQAVNALRQAVERMEKGIALAVFPEGTRSPDQRLLPFKKGGFYVAVDTGYPILPVSIRNSGRILGKKALLPRMGRISVTIHPPITTAGLTRADIPALSARVREVILSGLPESRALEPSS